MFSREISSLQLPPTIRQVSWLTWFPVRVVSGASKLSFLANNCTSVLKQKLQASGFRTVGELQRIGPIDLARGALDKHTSRE